MNNYNALHALITISNALYMKALSKVLPNILLTRYLYLDFEGALHTLSKLLVEYWLEISG